MMIIVSGSHLIPFGKRLVLKSLNLAYSLLIVGEVTVPWLTVRVILHTFPECDVTT